MTQYPRIQGKWERRVRYPAWRAKVAVIELALGALRTLAPHMLHEKYRQRYVTPLWSR